jgi:hypothetical protein
MSQIFAEAIQKADVLLEALRGSASFVAVTS